MTHAPLPPFPLADLRAVVERLDKLGRLARVRTPVDPVHQLAAIAARFEGRPHALLFEDVKGTDCPVLIGLYWSRELLADLLDVPQADLSGHITRCIARWQKEPVAPVVVPQGAVQEISEDDVDLSRLPIPTHAALDGGPYLDAAVLIARDPETGTRNASIQRLMVVGKDQLAINIDEGRHLGVYLAKAARQGRTLPITVNIGVGPGLYFAAATPAQAAPIDTDELGIASHIDGQPLKLLAGTLSDVEMAADAMIALECEILPDQRVREGPFAQVTRYYGSVDERPLVQVKRVHRRARPIFQTILSGVEVFNSVGLLGEASLLELLQRQVPGVLAVHFSPGGCGFYHAIVQLRQRGPGWAKQAIMAAFAGFPPLKMVTVVDEDVDLHDPADVEWAMATRLLPETGIVIVRNAYGHELNPGFPGNLGGKVGFDATRPYPPVPAHTRAVTHPVDLKDFDILLPRRL